MPFSQDTLDFLFENRMQDSRLWFEEHKEAYRRLVYEPLQALVSALEPTMLALDGALTTEARVDKTICRIRRDTRFSKDKSLYRDHMWIVFKRGKMHGTELPGFYFEIGGDGFNYGCGFYNASTAYMETLRSLVLQQDPAFQKASRAFAAQDVFHLEGDCYRRLHYPDQPPALQQWLERRGICFVADSEDLDLLFSNRLADKLAADFRLLGPMYDFLLSVSETVQRQEAARAAAQR